jgi:hypothetical protein
MLLKFTHMETINNTRYQDDALTVDKFDVDIGDTVELDLVRFCPCTLVYFNGISNYYGNSHYCLFISGFDGWFSI